MSFSLQALIKQLHRNEKGAIAIIFALILPALLAIMGLAIDFGYLYVMKSRLQDVADATALAGAREMHREGRYAGHAADDNRSELAVGKAIVDFVKVNDEDFKDISLDALTYKGTYRYSSNNELLEDVITLNDSNINFVKLMDYAAWVKPENGPLLTSDLQCKVEYAISGRLNALNFLDANIDENGHIISDYVADDRVRVRLTKRVPLAFLNIVLGEKYANGIPLIAVAAAKAVSKKNSDVEPKTVKSPTLYSLGGVIDTEACGPDSIVANGAIDLSGNNGAAPFYRGVSNNGFFVSTAANHMEYANDKSKFEALGNNGHVYAIGRTTNNDPNTSIETTGSYIVLKPLAKGTAVGVDMTASYEEDKEHPRDYSKNTPFYEVVKVGEGINSSSYRLVTDVATIAMLKNIIDHARNMEIRTWDSSLATAGNQSYWQAKQKFDSFSTEAVKSQYKNSVDNKRYLTNNIERWENGKLQTTVNNIVKDWSASLDSQGLELYVEANGWDALSKGIVNVNEGQAFVNGPGVPVLTNYNLTYSSGHVTKINSAYFSGGVTIATSGVTYGDIFCNGPLYISGDNNVFNGTLYASQIYIVGKINKMFTDSSYDNVGLFASNIYIGKGPATSVGEDSNGNKYIRVAQPTAPLPDDYGFSVELGWGSQGIIDDGSSSDNGQVSYTATLVE